MKAIKIGVVGASGYSGMELLRYLLQHPLAELTFVTSRQHAGQTISQVFPDFGDSPAPTSSLPSPTSTQCAKAAPRTRS